MIEKSGDPGLRVVVRPYNADVERLDEDLRRACVVLMPSSTEGFGLVGLEAISAGVPVCISDQSGLGELLKELLGDSTRRYVYPITQDDSVDVRAWSSAIDRVIHDLPAAFRRAAELREQLAKQLTWPKAVRVLVAAVEAE